MLLEEFDVDKYERSLKDAGREEGRREGLQEGLCQGLSQGRVSERERIQTLYQRLKSDNRMDDLLKAIDDPGYQELLFQEYGL